jgi:hypothetical protein
MPTSATGMDYGSIRKYQEDCYRERFRKYQSQNRDDCQKQNQAYRDDFGISEHSDRSSAGDSDLTFLGGRKVEDCKLELVRRRS